MCPVPRATTFDVAASCSLAGAIACRPRAPQAASGVATWSPIASIRVTMHAGAAASPDLALACLACASSRRAVPSARAASSTARRRRRNSASSVPHAMSGRPQRGASRGGTVLQIAAVVFRLSQYLFQTRCSRDGLAIAGSLPPRQAPDRTRSAMPFHNARMDRARRVRVFSIVVVAARDRARQRAAHIDRGIALALGDATVQHHVPVPRAAHRIGHRFVVVIVPTSTVNGAVICPVAPFGRSASGPARASSLGSSANPRGG